MLRACTLVMLVAAAGAAAGLLLDGREVTGAPLWLKPLKFAVSGAIYTATVAWMTAPLPASPALTGAHRLIGTVLVLENVLVGAQAARGSTSHFNVGTRLDAAIFATMGAAIALLWVATLVVLVLHGRTPLPDRAMALAVRLGLATSLAGSAVGGLMTRPTAAQAAALAAGDRPTVLGAHTVGAPDGAGTLLPGIRWSASHGDLRVPHFVGLHAMQALPLLLGLVRLLGSPGPGVQTALVAMAAVGYLGLFLATLGQALAGRPLLALGG